MAFNVCSVQYANWHLNETSGTNAIDATGHGYNGTLVNTPTWVAGKLNNCLNFVSGSSQYVDCGAIASFERTQACSYEFWLNAASSGVQDTIGKYDGAAVRGTIITLNGSAFYFLLATSGTNYLLVQTSKTVANSAWHHIIVTYNGTSLASGVLFYVDGAVDASPSVLSNNLNGTILNGNNFTIARTRNGGYLTGKIDEIVIYDRVLTSTEVDGRYNSGVGTQSCRMPSSNALISHDF